MNAWSKFQEKINSETAKVSPLEWALWNGRNQSSDECLELAAAELAERDALKVIVAWQSGNLSEGMAAKLVKVDRLKLRTVRDEIIDGIIDALAKGEPK